MDKFISLAHIRLLRMLNFVALGANYRYENAQPQVTYDIQNSLWQISQMYTDYARGKFDTYALF